MACGEVQGTKPALFRRHVKVEFASPLVKAKVAVREWLSAGGVDVIVVCGGTVSILHRYSVAGPTSASHTPRTANVCEPFERLVYRRGLEHLPNAPPSNAH